MEGNSAENPHIIRHRENKRRYRARQREYVEGLQRRLADAHNQQVAGMREVQLAGQKVANDNSRLRALIRFMGVEDAVVESWLHGIETPARQLPRMSKRTNSNSVSTKSTQTCSDLGRVLSANSSYPDDTTWELLTSPPSQKSTSTLDVQGLRNKSPSSTLETFDSRRPCTSVPHILAQPSVESQGVTDLTPAGTANGDIECSMAQKLVLPFATTNDKVDAISMKLKEGCVIDQCGGCRVKAKVMWEILEDAMNET
ncbi:uncharacterized protein Z519_05488 [Cladophialophora bantiana CBS 173.52]|uniref:BZIP domain-containing protein n=1 Tax=Cladophialophora bantiana (strain ATCC 10958 / CBS 173.52 / CDC B-1940 / NIH 8579) TaxID=1442370 RepID=A0A0D2G6E8_CLAB1|nr:uncharacterized protein Z519_05488 [Cladophialophora bantiana CBS 173.52]KIW94172.1 hypothetical protein Z519_05488 [Cladophialophora bantiana CBS 173.52]